MNNGYPVHKMLKIALIVFLVFSTGLTCLYPIPEFADNMWLQHIGTLLLLIPLLHDSIKNRLSLSAYFCLTCFAVLHIVGARYIYTYVPYGEWMSAIGANPDLFATVMDFGAKSGHSNQYDRLVHFAFGVLMFPCLLHVTRKWIAQKPLVAILMAWLFIQTFSMIYEVFEWQLSVWCDGGDAYNGQQGDIWDAQKDMAFAMIGSTIMAITYAISAYMNGCLRGTKDDERQLAKHVCAILAVAGLTLLPAGLLAHPDRAYHYNDAARIMNGFGTPDYKDAMASIRRVAANDFSPNAALSTIQSERAFAGFGELFEQVSSKMDGMPRELEIKFGLKRGTLSHPKVHRLLCHGWGLDSDPPGHVLALFQKRTGIDKMELLNYWRNYQIETFALAEKYTGLPSSKAKAFAGLIWDIHLVCDWTPDNTEVSKLVPIKSITEDFCKKIQILLGEGRRADYVCGKTAEFVESRIGKGMATRHIAEELRNWLPEQKIGTEIFMANKESLKSVWNRAVAENINQANATIRTQKKLEAIVAEKELKHLAKEAKLRAKSVVYMPKEEVKPLNVVRDLKAQCKDAKLAKGVIPEAMKPQNGYLIPITYRSGRKSSVLVLKSSAVRAGTEIAAKDGTGAAVKAGVGTATKAGATVSSAAMAGAVEGVCAFVISSGVAFTLYQYGAIDDEELKDEFAKAAISGAVVGTAVGVSVALGASPFGPVVIAVGIGGYIVCDIAFELIKGQPFTCDDILGYMDEEFEDTVSFFTAGTEPTESFADKKGKASFVDEPKIPTFTDFGSRQKSFVDFTD